MWTSRLARLACIYLLVFVGLRATVAAPVRCSNVTPASARAAAAAAADWIVANQHDDGGYTYLVRSDGEVVAGQYSNVRHAGVTLALYQAARQLGNDRYRAAADRALRWMQDRVVDVDAAEALSEGRFAPLGGSALLLAALVERREFTGDTSHDSLMRGLGRFLVSQQREDGGFHLGVDLGTRRSNTELTSPYFPGEALWALSQLNEVLPSEPVAATIERAARFIATERDDKENVTVPPINDHWASYGFAHMAEPGNVGLTGAEVSYSRDLYARFALLIRWEAQRDEGPVYALTHGSERQAAAVGTWLEGQAALARLTRADDRLEDLQDETLDSARCVGAVLVERQRDSGPETVAGAWFAGGETRMDDQQHTISGLLALARLLEAEATR